MDRQAILIFIGGISMKIKQNNPSSPFRLNLNSRHGVDDALWKILVVAGVSVIALIVLFPLVNKILALGQSAINRIGTPGW